MMIHTHICATVHLSPPVTLSIPVGPGGKSMLSRFDMVEAWGNADRTKVVSMIQGHYVDERGRNIYGKSFLSPDTFEEARALITDPIWEAVRKAEAMAQAMMDAAREVEEAAS
nr:MAG TPA: hypothetical protein [Bacteriophage sp.]